MANPLRGEVDLEVDGKTYVLALGINEIVTIEQLLDIGIADIAAWFNDPALVRLGNIRAVLYAALQRHHSGLTLEDAGDLIGRAGLNQAVMLLGEAIQAAFPKAEGKAKNPPKRGRAGTGARS